MKLQRLVLVNHNHKKSHRNIFFYTKVIFYIIFFLSSRSIGEKSSLKSNHDYEQILFGLLTKNDIDSIKQIPHQNTSLTIQLNTMVDSYNQNALLLSVKLNNIMMSDYLVSLGKSTGQTEFLDHCDESGWTPLRYSAWMGNEDIVKILIENGASVDVSDSEGRTALRAACFSGHKNIVDLLLKHGADGLFFLNNYFLNLQSFNLYKLFSSQ